MSVLIALIEWHVAGDMFPSDYNMSIINAQHGSWDRNVPLGYRVMVLNLGEDGLARNYSALAEGWLLPNNTVWGKSASAQHDVFLLAMLLRQLLYLHFRCFMSELAEKVTSNGTLSYC